MTAWFREAGAAGRPDRSMFPVRLLSRPGALARQIASRWSRRRRGADSRVALAGPSENRRVRTLRWSCCYRPSFWKRRRGSCPSMPIAPRTWTSPSRACSREPSGGQALRALGGRRAAAADQTPCERGIRTRGAGGHGRLPVRPMGGAARAGGSRRAAGDVLRWLSRGLRDFVHPRLPAVPRPGNQRAGSGKVASGGTVVQSRTLRDQCGRLGGPRGGEAERRGAQAAVRRDDHRDRPPRGPFRRLL